MVVGPVVVAEPNCPYAQAELHHTPSRPKDGDQQHRELLAANLAMYMGRSVRVDPSNQAIPKLIRFPHPEPMTIRIVCLINELHGVCIMVYARDMFASACYGKHGMAMRARMLADIIMITTLAVLPRLRSSTHPRSMGSRSKCASDCGSPQPSL